MYDVIIAGSGPAGAFCALSLAQAGKKVLLIEKQNLPRYKPCGGGLSQKSYSLLKDVLQSELDTIIESEIYNVDFIYKHKNTVSLTFDYPVIMMSMRDKLDYAIVRKAEKYETQIHTEERILQIEQHEDSVHITTDKSRYKAKYFIGADGANGITAKLFNINKKNAIAVEGEIKVSSDMKFPNNKIELHYGIIPHGYGWVFPKGDIISIGIGSFLPSLKGLNKYYYKFKKEIGLENKKEIILKGHPIPILKDKNPSFHKNRILLTGDAAGLVDPLCGEGIYYALLCGKWAAEAIISNQLENYTKKINKQLLPNLKQAEILSLVIYNTLPVINRLVNSDPDVAKKLIEVVYGSNTYKDLFNYLAGKYTLFKKASHQA